MQQTFKFKLDQKVVVLGNGVIGNVVTNSISSAMTQPRIFVRYFTHDGGMFEAWFDEDTLAAAE